MMLYITIHSYMILRNPAKVDTRPRLSPYRHLGQLQHGKVQAANTGRFTAAGGSSSIASSSVLLVGVLLRLW